MWDSSCSQAKGLSAKSPGRSSADVKNFTEFIGLIPAIGPKAEGLTRSCEINVVRVLTRGHEDLDVSLVDEIADRHSAAISRI